MARRTTGAKKRARARRVRRISTPRKVRRARRPSRPSPIPVGFHTVTPSLVFRDAAAAIAFYEKAFDAKELSRMPRPDGKGIWHASIRIGDSIVFLADEVPGGPAAVRAPTPEAPATLAMWLYVKDCDAAFERAVAAGGRVVMPLQDMFWGDRYGMVADPFGMAWGLATHVRDVPPEEMARAARAAAPA
jgi:PhnB protein